MENHRVEHVDREPIAESKLPRFYELIGMLIASPARLAIAKQLLKKQPLSAQELGTLANESLQKADLGTIGPDDLIRDIDALIVEGMLAKSREGYRLTRRGYKATLQAAKPLPPFVPRTELPA